MNGKRTTGGRRRQREWHRRTGLDEDSENRTGFEDDGRTTGGRREEDERRGQQIGDEEGDGAAAMRARVRAGGRAIEKMKTLGAPEVTNPFG
ncbi:hypothetical protein ACLOJK_017537 [Asimina triloba]